MLAASLISCRKFAARSPCADYHSVMRRFAVILSIICTACVTASTVAPKDVPLGADFDLSPNQSAVLDSGALTISLIKVTDSRCPSGVECIWAGDAETALWLSVPQQKSTAAALHTTLDPKTLTTSNAYTIRLVGVKPYPKQGSTISQGDYVATLRVTKQ
jgi:hypothetical protein